MRPSNPPIVSLKTKSALSAAVVIFSGMVAAATPRSDITAITLERTPCYGTCPSYKLTLKCDGTVLYEGKDYVKVKGTRTERISLQSFEQVLKKLQKIRFFDLQDEYLSLEVNGSSMFVTDQPTTITSVTRGGRTKKVKDYFGGPKGLYELEQMIDEVARSKAWVRGQSRENRDVPYYDSFPLHRRLTFRALLEGASTSTNDALSHPSKYSHYVLMFVNNAMSFDLRATSSINLSQFDGYIVDATGTLEEDRKTKALTFSVSKVRPIRRYSVN